MVPVSRAADDPGFLDEKGAAGQLGGRGNLLCGEGGAAEQAEGKQSLHEEWLLRNRCGKRD